MKFGLTNIQINLLTSIFKQYKIQGKVIIYGSRSKGNYTDRSDVDFVIKDYINKDRHFISNLNEIIEESDFPYLCDIQYYEDIKNIALKSHIQRKGQVFYEC